MSTKGKSLSVESTENINVREDLAKLGGNAALAVVDALSENGINLDERMQRKAREAAGAKLVKEAHPIIHSWLAQRDAFAEAQAESHAAQVKDYEAEVKRLEKAVERADRSAEERLAAKDRVHAVEVADLKAEIKRLVGVVKLVRSQVKEED